MSNILDKSVLDSKDYNDPNSVLYRGVLSGNEMENENRKEKEIDNNRNGIFLCDTKGNLMDKWGRNFFEILNDRCSKIFKFDLKTGEIQLKENESASSVIGNSEHSQILAKLIEENIGVNAKQNIKLRVGNELTIVEDGITKPITFDSIVYGLVAFDDFKFNGLVKYKNVLQAVMIAHFIHERVNKENYEKLIGNLDKMMVDFDVLHGKACEFEAEIWSEMTGEFSTTRLELYGWKHPISNKYSERFYYSQFYYTMNTGILGISDTKNKGKMKFEDIFQ